MINELKRMGIDVLLIFYAVLFILAMLVKTASRIGRRYDNIQNDSSTGEHD